METLRYAQSFRASNRQSGMDASDALGVSGVLQKHLYRMSGGEQQRAARGAAVKNPSLVLADAPGSAHVAAILVLLPPFLL
jgi:ABC-type lipoprotein export system ATPase subunit